MPIFTYESLSREELIRECQNKQAVINHLNELLSGPNFNQERDAHADTIATEYALSERGESQTLMVDNVLSESSLIADQLPPVGKRVAEADAEHMPTVKAREPFCWFWEGQISHTKLGPDWIPLYDLR